MKIYGSVVLVLGMLIFASCGKDDDCICPEVFAPVCGTDGVSYSNSCEATCAGVTFREGTCGWIGSTPLMVWDSGSVDLDGCGWLLIEGFNSDAIAIYHPEGGLAPEYQQDSLIVNVAYSLLPDTVFVCGLLADDYSVIQVDSIGY